MNNIEYVPNFWRRVLILTFSLAFGVLGAVLLFFVIGDILGGRIFNEVPFGLGIIMEGIAYAFFRLK